jgi:hypothetical protein
MLRAVKDDLELNASAVHGIRCECGNMCIGQIDPLKQCVENMPDMSRYYRFFRANIEDN